MPRRKNTVVFDANMILRYLLNDNTEMAEKAEKYLNTCTVFVTTEVIAEVVYVSEGVYHMNRTKIAETIGDFMQMVQSRDRETICLALETYGQENLDFVDCVLYAYNRVENLEIATFDRKLLRLLGR